MAPKTKNTLCARVRMASGLAVTLCAVALASSATAQDIGQAIANASGVPQIPAFLPDKYSVPASEPMPIDGLWMVSTIRKKIRIEQGRAYAVDSWLHLFTLKIMPDMVVMQNFRRTGPGQFAADDLPLMGPATMTLNGNGNLDVTVQGMFGPVRYGLTRLEARYPDVLASEVQAATGQTVTIPPPASVTPYPTPVQPAPVTQPAPIGTEPAPAPMPVAPPAETPGDCRPIGIDPDTGAIICA